MADPDFESLVVGTLTVLERLTVVDAANASRAATVSFVGDTLRIESTEAVARVEIRSQAIDHIAVERVRIDGGERVEVHADAVTRLDAGGTGITYMPTWWASYLPEWAGSSHARYQPEHPDSGGPAYAPLLGGDGAALLDDYYARFPDERPEDGE
ncbi:hypothetical protein [Roseospira goensis]|uniref:DNA-binding transcriptional LysR family regulator n=1 Tax=Roseospira goensis TaxID=391922 RepID=A0A7W6WME1_9PROT|nr:hypothetical protein [Roseospira goensis]MBB4287668.1 DNA-binding transcriptional LysR family regulator [Roseospira goensis]